MIPRIPIYASRKLAVRSNGPIFQRSIHSNLVVREGVKDKVKELGHKVNINVGKGLASAIDTGEKVTHATKEKLGSAEGNVQEGKDFAEKKAEDVGKGAQRAKEDLKKEVTK